MIKKTHNKEYLTIEVEENIEAQNSIIIET